MLSAMKTKRYIFFSGYSLVMIIPVTSSIAVIAPADWLMFVTRKGRKSKTLKNIFTKLVCPV
jgi:hypothetical protein